MRRPYIGITGFAAADETAGVVAALPALPGRLLMCGVLLSNARLAGRPGGAPNRCPPAGDIPGIFLDDERCLNLVHYRPRAGDDLAAALLRATEVGGPNCHGVQINATRGQPWPDPAAVAAYRRQGRPRRIVLQVGREAMASVGGDPERLAGRCAEYGGIVTDLLVDASEGLGRPLDAAELAGYLTAIAAAAPEPGLAVAGGLCAGNVGGLLAPLLEEWGHRISIDAEGRLRDADDRLEVAAAVGYWRAAARLLA